MPVGFLWFEGHVLTDPPGSVWRNDHGLSVVASIEDEDGPAPLLCVAVGHDEREPTEDDLRAIQRAFYGGQGATLETPEELEVPGVWSFRQKKREQTRRGDDASGGDLGFQSRMEDFRRELSEAESAY